MKSRKTKEHSKTLRKNGYYNIIMRYIFTNITYKENKGQTLPNAPLLKYSRRPGDKLSPESQTQYRMILSPWVFCQSKVIVNGKEWKITLEDSKESLYKLLKIKAKLLLC